MGFWKGLKRVFSSDKGTQKPESVSYGIDEKPIEVRLTDGGFTVKKEGQRVQRVQLNHVEFI